MSLTHRTKIMTNFEYWGHSGNRGTSGNDIFRIGGGGQPSARHHNGWIDGGDGKDTFVISGKKEDWEIRKNGKNHFLTTEVSGIFSDSETVTIQLSNVEKVEFMDGSFNLVKPKASPQKKTEASEPVFNEIIGGNKNDELKGGNKNDFVWGANGEDTLHGGQGNDLIVGGKGVDFLYGGSGKDDFGISKEMGKGSKNYDIVMDFEDGKDRIYIEGSTKGLWIDSYEGATVIVSGKNDVLAFIADTAGKLNWSGDGNFIA